jgi:hypothetical protein
LALHLLKIGLIEGAEVVIGAFKDVLHFVRVLKPKSHPHISSERETDHIQE